MDDCAHYLLDPQIDIVPWTTVIDELQTEAEAGEGAVSEAEAASVEKGVEGAKKVT